MWVNIPAPWSIWDMYYLYLFGYRSLAMGIFTLQYTNKKLWKTADSPRCFDAFHAYLSLLEGNSKGLCKRGKMT